MLGSRKVTTLGGDKFKDEYSLAFDGTDDYIATTLNGNTFDGDFTISAWVKNESEDIYHSIFSHYQDSDNYMNFYIPKSSVTSANKIGFHGKVGGTNYYVTGTTQIFATNDWVHVVFTQDDSSNAQFMYVNGVVDQDETRDFDMDMAGTTYIGKLSPSSSHIHQGNISEIAIYDTALSASQVKTLYNGREPYNHKEGIASSNLKAWWRMGDGTLDKASLDRAGDDSGLICDEVNPTLGAELVSNGDFDDETNWSDYQMEGDDTADLSTEQVLVGSNSLKIDVSNAGEGTRLGGVATTTGKTYRISAWFYVTAGTAKINPGDDKWSPDGLEPKTNVTNEWQQLVTYNTADTDEANAWIYFQAGSNSSVFYLDNVSVREVQGNPGIFLNSDTQFTGDTP